jgi:phosphoglycolate phosphatase-like HAD superfamily hydrolase
MDPIIVFDFDGTLADTMPHLAQIASDVVGEMFDIPDAIVKDWYWSTAGFPFITQLDFLAKDFMISPADVAACAAMFEVDAIEVYSTDSFFPDAIIAIRTLEYKCHIVSSAASEHVKRMVKRCWHPAIRCVQNEIKSEALELLSIDNRRMIYIGDVPRDALYAQDVGADFIGIERGAPITWPEETTVANGLMEALDLVHAH